MKRPTGIVMSVVIAIIVGGMLIWFVVSKSGKSNTKVSFGATDVFEAGRVQPLAENIAKHGPVFYRALTKGGPDIYVQHVGAEARVGWHAFDARRAGQARECTLVWQPASANFVDPCTKETVPADGTGLPQYKTTVTEDTLTVDLRAAP